MTPSLPSTQQFFSTSEMLNSDFTYYRINQLVKDGKLRKLNKRMYENLDYEGEVSDFAAAAAYAPKGILCMMTAARYYGLTTYLPDAVDIAIGRSMKISTLPDWPALHIWYFSQKRYEEGLTMISDNTGNYRIYSMEKTVADILYYRNKIGIEETKEVLTNYLSHPERNLATLHRYAEALGSGQILRTYLEVLL